ncbi:MAG TPA: S8 family serine peptidase [Bacteroidota bacterium]|nr:S8 family serine peptidase [Bacteroidota bacterium]
MRRFAFVYVSVALLFVAGVSVHAQQRHWVFFTDRGTAGAIDAPPSAAYIGALERAGAVTHVRSRWFNAVSVSADNEALAAIRALPFVSSVEAVRRYHLPKVEAAPALPKTRATQGYGLDYGFSLQQVEMINVPRVHDIWIDGTDIMVGMLDNGYRWRGHEAFAMSNIVAELDVINGDSLTENEAGDPAGQDSHGTLTFSALGGFKQGQLIGPAFNAAFLLAKTEVNGSETQIEEDYWVEGLEWLESRGARIVSASLGYLDWDDGTMYSWEQGDLDGRTAVTTRAAVEAAKRGILLVTAMGNEGSAIGTIIAPADADSVISVGAVTYQGGVAGFSSSGPTSDNRIKPDICAPGVQVYSASRYGGDAYERSNGTSLATPLAAGVAALLRSARPELTPVQVREALRATADNTAQPDNRRGWGLINAWDAVLYHGMVISTNPKIFYAGGASTIMAWVVSPHAISGPVTLSYNAGGSRGTVAMTRVAPHSAEGLGAGSGLYSGEVLAFPQGTIVEFSIAATDSRETRTSPYGAPARNHVFTVGESRTLGAEGMLPANFSLEQSFPNPTHTVDGTQVTIRYGVPMPGARVTLMLHDALGRAVRTIATGEKSAGTYSAVINVADLATGVYYYSLSSGDTRIFRRMLIVR